MSKEASLKLINNKFKIQSVPLNAVRSMYILKCTRVNARAVQNNEPGWVRIQIGGAAGRAEPPSASRSRLLRKLSGNATN